MSEKRDLLQTQSSDEDLGDPSKLLGVSSLGRERLCVSVTDRHAPKQKGQASYVDFFPLIFFYLGYLAEGALCSVVGACPLN